MIPIFDTDLIKEKIVVHLGDAKKSIEIAMAWFTDSDLERVVFLRPLSIFAKKRCFLSKRCIFVE